jgi:orotate phosphoribosyltransferase
MAELSSKTLDSATHTLLSLPAYKSRLIRTCLDNKILKFGTFTLKSGRQSPYFFNAGEFHHAAILDSIASAYAEAIIAFAESASQRSKLGAGQTKHEEATAQGNKQEQTEQERVSTNAAQTEGDFDFDIVFGPAYKGIPLATLTCYKLGALDPQKYANTGLSFNRKEVKDHGEGGMIVGASLKGKKVLIIDDVITSGKAINEGVEIIKREGGTLVGIVVALDRKEKMPPSPEEKERGDNDNDGKPRQSAIGEVRNRYGVPVFSILTLEDIIDSLRGNATEDDVVRLEAYREKYRATD